MCIGSSHAATLSNQCAAHPMPRGKAPNHASKGTQQSPHRPLIVTLDPGIRRDQFASSLDRSQPSNKICRISRNGEARATITIPNSKVGRRYRVVVYAYVSADAFKLDSVLNNEAFINDQAATGTVKVTKVKSTSHARTAPYALSTSPLFHKIHGLILFRYHEWLSLVPRIPCSSPFSHVHAPHVSLPIATTHTCCGTLVRCMKLSFPGTSSTRVHFPGVRPERAPGRSSYAK